ncbi:hypothetical protein ABEB36_008766 [Hypothenemus hampei]|uniref:Uncharacterized protein n=1 Tax=Hypothenemus hampei TaxID=57062 RepID=A0ABD1EQX2_HYPHA
MGDWKCGIIFISCTTLIWAYKIELSPFLTPPRLDTLGKPFLDLKTSETSHHLTNQSHNSQLRRMQYNSPNDDYEENKNYIPEPDGNNTIQYGERFSTTTEDSYIKALERQAEIQVEKEFQKQQVDHRQRRGNADEANQVSLDQPARRTFKDDHHPKKEIHYHQHKHLHEHEHEQDHKHQHQDDHKEHHHHDHKKQEKHEHHHNAKHQHQHKGEHKHQEHSKHEHEHQQKHHHQHKDDHKHDHHHKSEHDHWSHHKHEHKEDSKHMHEEKSKQDHDHKHEHKEEDKHNHKHKWDHKHEHHHHHDNKHDHKHKNQHHHKHIHKKVKVHYKKEW